MRLRVEIDDALLAEAKMLLGVKSTREVVEIALRAAVYGRGDLLDREGDLKEERPGK